MVDTPTHLATFNTQSEAVQVLLEHKAEVNSQSSVRSTPLLCMSFALDFINRREMYLTFVRRLLEYGADTHITNSGHSPFHEASSRGLLEVTRLLLGYGAKVEKKGW